jgi:transposase-like protein
VSFCRNGWRITDNPTIERTLIDICQVKYLNNIVEQDHRFIKKITKPMMGFKALFLSISLDMVL